MPRKEREYKKLPGWGRRDESWISGTTSRLWLGRDHLLCVDSEMDYREKYKRFYYRDIQAFIVQKTNRGKGWNLGLSGLALIALLFGLSAGTTAFQAFWFVVMSVLILLFLLNWLAGPTCKSYVRTAVQTERLASLQRLRAADKVFARLLPLIEDAQGGFGREPAVDPGPGAAMPESNSPE